MFTLSPTQATALGNVTPQCDVPETGLIPSADLPEGTDVAECGLIGRKVDVEDGFVLEIPETGNSVSLTGDSSSGDGIELSLETEPSGEISYDMQGSVSQVAGSSAPAGLATNGCDYNFTASYYDTTKARGIGVHVGDGGQPAGDTQARTGRALDIAGQTWATENSPCNGADLSYATPINYVGTTTAESDFHVVDGKSTCDSRDGISTLDSGNLDNNGKPDGFVGMNCTWRDSGDHVIETDVRLNVHDFDFTYAPLPSQGCQSAYDVISVITHETGHTHGLQDDYYYKGYYQTMYGTSFRCSTVARDLGKEDVLTLRDQYPDPY